GAGPRQFVYDIGNHLETKMQSVACYRTQFPGEKKYVFERVRSMAIACGQSAGFVAGEPLTSVRPLGSQNLLQTLGLS
ncbi:MAG: LmbE family protein, partial [Planctomycetota bacterium]